MRLGLSGFAADCERQREVVAERVPAYGELLRVIVEHADEVARRLEKAWAARTFAAWYERPLLLLASLRYDALRDGTSHPLYSPLALGEITSELSFLSLEHALAPTRTELWRALSQRAVQTNETSRGIVWILPASLLARAVPAARLVLADLGASAGLNLAADTLPSLWTTQSAQPGGDSVESESKPFVWSRLPPIVARRGFDQSPLDVDHADDARWLEACVWPGETERLSRLTAAIHAFRDLKRSSVPPRITRASMVEMPGLLAELTHESASSFTSQTQASTSNSREATWVLAYQTIVRDYLSDEDRAEYYAGMRAWLASQPRALWVELEGTPGVGDLDLAFSITVHTAKDSYEVARTGPHPRLLKLNMARVAALDSELQSGSSEAG